ncbi:MAG TPA: agmatinase [Burkholderiaceae bacterium]|nr:agmatinase [Burkholderiaceae bacterium]
MIDSEKLNKLREKYAEGEGAMIHDPEFARAAEAAASCGSLIAPPYSGMSTFLDAPYRPDVLDEPGSEPIDIALLGIPMDLGVTNRAGARLGPRAVRFIERVGLYEHALRMAPAELCRFADVGDVPFESRYDLLACHRNIESFIAALLDAGIVPLSVGGDHSVTLPILRAVGRERPVGLVHVDAHCDTGGKLEGNKFHHGGPFRHAVLEGVLDPERTIQIGIRGQSEFLWEFSYESGMTVLHAEKVAELGIDAVVQRAREVVGDGPVYVSFDVDALDPAFAPGTGTPEVGGLSTLDALRLLRGLMGLDVVGGDVVEVAPQYDPTTNTAHAAAQILFQILCLAAKAVDLRRTAHK